MKNIKRNLLLTGCFALMMSVCGLLMLLGPSPRQPEAFAGNGADGRPAITAQYTEFPGFGAGGVIKVNNQPLTGNTVYSNTPAGPANTVKLEAVPDDHFEFVELTVRIGDYNTTTEQFTQDTVAGFPQTLSGETVFNLTLSEDRDYQITATFAKVVYDLNFWAAYYGTETQKVPGLLGGTGFAVPSKTTIEIGETITFENKNIITDEEEGTRTRYDARFCYVDIISAESNGNLGRTNIGEENKYSVTFDAANLAQYADTNAKEINIVGVYIETPLVTITGQNTDPSAIQLVAVSPLLIIEGGSAVKSYSGAGEYYLDKGTTLTVNASSGPYFTFNQFKVNGTPAGGSGNQLIRTISASTAIEVVFDAKQFTLSISGVAGTLDVPLEDAVHAFINNTEGFGFNYGDVLTKITFDGIAGYDLESVSFKRSGGTDDFAIEDVKNKPLDDDFLTEYLYNNKEVRIVLTFTKLSALNIIIPTASLSMGDYEVRVVGAGGTLSDPLDLSISANKYFRPDKVVQITPVPNKYHKFQSLTGIAEEDMEEVGDVKIATIAMTYDRTVNLGFRAESLKLKTKANVDFESSRDTFVIGDTLVITFDVSSNNHIKTLQIHGTDVSKLPDAKLKDNTLTITLSQDFIAFFASNPNAWDGEYFVIGNIVKTGLKPAILLGISIPSVVLPLLLLILLCFVIVNTKRSRFIKKQLQEKRTEGIKRNVGGYISDLREGTAKTAITKEDVKQAMKEQKDKK